MSGAVHLSQGLGRFAHTLSLKEYDSSRPTPIGQTASNDDWLYHAPQTG